MHLNKEPGYASQKEEAEMERLREQERIRSGKELQVSRGVSCDPAAETSDRMHLLRNWTVSTVCHRLHSNTF